MRKGFTLAEMMVVLLIIGVVSAIIIPVLITNVGDTNKVLFKSGYRIVETAVNDLIADISLYPAGELDNTFCNNFINKVNTIGSRNCDTSSFVTKTPNFITTNGMAWYGFDTANTDFQNGTEFSNIVVDVDGIQKGKNLEGSDLLTIQVFLTGKVSVSGDTESSYLQN